MNFNPMHVAGSGFQQYLESLGIAPNRIGGANSIGLNQNIDLIYNQLLGRNADSPGRDYWTRKLTAGGGDSYKDLVAAIQGSDEYIGQQDYIADNPDYTQDDLNNLSTAFQNPYAAGSGHVMEGWEPGDPLPSGYETYFGSQDPATTGDDTTGDDTTGDDTTVDDTTGGGTNTIIKEKYGGPTLDQFKKMLQDTFGNPWTPWGYGWGGTNSGGVRINKSQASKLGSAYAGNKSSFNRQGSRLNTQGTPWMGT